MTRTRRATETGLTLAAPVTLLLVWEILSRTGVIDPLFWPAPSTLGDTAWELLRDGTLLGNVGTSLGRILVGFVLGAVPAVLFGLLMGLFWPIRAFLMPIATVIYAIPKISIVPLVFVVFGFGETSMYVVVAISIFFLVLLNTVSGVLQIDRTYRDVARNFGAGPLGLFLTVALPGALPAIFTGLRLGLGFALVVIVGTEFITAGGGIGRYIYDSWQIYAIDKMFVGLIATGLLGWLLTLALNLLERVVLPWRPAS
ncbi:MAG: ABC transporter permease [Chloroflexota bacterium]|nr:ABC transporter permease [Chloroflexota bacterium]